MSRRRLVALALALSAGAIAGAAEAQTLGPLRDAVRGAAAASFPIGVEKETEIGAGIAATVAGRWKVLEDSALTEYVELVGQVVAQQSPRATEVAFRFAVLDTDEVNAFAAPGGFVFVTRGALELMESEAELAGVLAHEIAHVDLKHVLEQIRRADMLRGAGEEAEIDAELVDELSTLGAGLLFTGLGRKDELASDALAMRYAAAAGYRADGLATFVARLREDSTAVPRRRSRLAELHATHPPPEARLEALAAAAAAGGIDPAAGAVLAERFRARVPRPPSAPVAGGAEGGY